MAILNQIRQRSLFLILVIAMALFSFVLADVIRNSSGFSLPDQNVVATINGIEMQREDFMRKVENLERQNRGSVGLDLGGFHLNLKLIMHPILNHNNIICLEFYDYHICVL